ncbi:hypothetical protein AAG906_040065 [Vitis piasezkii]
MFVTTTDPMLEPPIITVNTVLSLLALDYPANKLSCYVSDDGASRLTFYSLLEASKFAKLWVPFCKKYGIQTRAPFRYFSTELERYEELGQKIEGATLKEKHPRHPHHYKAGAMNVLYVGSGIAGLQGPMYGGTGCFHRRKVIYGLWPEGRMEIKVRSGGS